MCMCGGVIVIDSLTSMDDKFFEIFMKYLQMSAYSSQQVTLTASILQC